LVREVKRRMEGGQSDVAGGILAGVDGNLRAHAHMPSWI
jgi:hypothetical protein